MTCSPGATTMRLTQSARQSDHRGGLEAVVYSTAPVSHVRVRSNGALRHLHHLDVRHLIGGQGEQLGLARRVPSRGKRRHFAWPELAPPQPARRIIAVRAAPNAIRRFPLPSAWHWTHRDFTLFFMAGSWFPRLGEVVRARSYTWRANPDRPVRSRGSSAPRRGNRAGWHRRARRRTG